MTINTTSTSSGPYTGTGAVDTYAYDFKIQLSSEIVVVETDAASVSTTLVEGTNYSVTGVGVNGGGNVVRTAGNLPTGYTWFISRATAQTQEADFAGQGPFTPLSHENAFDKLTQILQEIDDKTIDIPASVRAGNIYSFDDAGDSEANIDADAVRAVVAGALATGVAMTVDSFTGDGSTAGFTMSISPPSANSVLATIDGVMQLPGTDFTISGAVVTFNAAPPNSSSVVLRNIGNTAPALTVDSTNVSHLVSKTGAVTRNVQSALMERTSISDFGAVGDGIADDTVPIQNALDALEASGGIVFGDPSANYFFTTNIIVPTGVTLDGQGCTFTADSTGFTLVKVASNPAGVMTNKNRFSFGSAPDVVHFRNFTLDCGIQELSAGIMLSNTTGSSIDNVRVITTAGTSMSALIDLDGQNTHVRITRNRLEQIQGAGVNGACIAIRNPDQVIISEDIVIRDNYLKKIGPSNTDELMWINGAGGDTRNVRVLSNTFETGATDTSSSALTIYRFTNSGAIPNALCSDIIVSDNYFNCEHSTFTVILLGFTGDTTGTPLHNVRIRGNTIKFKLGAGIAAASNISDILINENSFENTNTDTTTLTAISLSTWPNEPATVSGNRAFGKISRFAIGLADVVDNYVDDCLIFAKGCNSVKGNNANCRQMATMIEVDCDVTDNLFKMTEYSGDASEGGLHYTFYVTGADIGSKIQDNKAVIYDPRIGIHRSSAALTPKLQFSRNEISDKVFTITGAANNGGGLIRITSVAHQMTTGKQCVISGVGGTTEANGTWTVTFVDADNFDLDSSTFTNTYTSGGEFYGINTGFQVFSTAFRDLYDNFFNGVAQRRTSYVSGQPSGLVMHEEEALTTLDNTGTPTVRGGHVFKTGGATAITDFDNGVVGQTIKVIAAHTVTVTDGAPIILAGSFAMTPSDTLTLTMFDDQVWQEVSRSVN